MDNRRGVIIHMKSKIIQKYLNILARTNNTRGSRRAYIAHLEPNATKWLAIFQ